MTGWGWTMMLLWSSVWIGLLIVLVWAVASWARGRSDAPSERAAHAKTARETLDDRLAAGEIDIDEYKRRRAALG